MHTVKTKFMRIGANIDGAVETTTKSGNSRIIVGHAYIELYEKELVVHLPTSQGLISDTGFGAFNYVLDRLYQEQLISDEYVVHHREAKSSVFRYELHLEKFVASIGWTQCYDNHDGLYHIPLASQEIEPQCKQPKDFEDMLCIL